MFENINGQDSATNLLKGDIINKTYSNSIIFYGQNNTGKLTTALEFARAINCEREGAIDCNCYSCKRIKSLDFEGMLFISRRNFYYNLFEFVVHYKKYKDSTSYDMIKQTIKLISMPLQNFLIRNVSNESEINRVISKSEKINDILIKDEYTSVDLEKLLEYSLSVSSLYKTKNIPIKMMRNMLDWTYIAQPDIKKVVIIDNVDYLEESSRNVLLKRIEEPSENLFFILLAENRDKIIATILSRCRTYFFRPLSDASVHKILNTKFDEDTNYKSLSAFFERSSEISDEKMTAIALKLLNLVFLKDHTFSELNLFIQGFNKINLKNVTERDFTKALLNALNRLLEEYFHSFYLNTLNTVNNSPFKILNSVSYTFLINLKKLISDKYYKLTVFSLSPSLVLEGIFYPLKSMVLNDRL